VVARRLTLATVGAVVLLAAACTGGGGSPEHETTTTTTTTPSGSPPAFGVRVSKNRLVDLTGKRLGLQGVNRPGTEYRCTWAEGGGFVTDSNGSDGTRLDYAPEVAAALATWNAPGSTAKAINLVRIPLNEACWLGINGVNPAYSGPSYQQFVRDEVAAHSARGIATILDLHWSAPGEHPATHQDVAPNVNHSVSFWREVATSFRGDRSVMFDLFNEPRLSCFTDACDDYDTRVSYEGACYRDGCRYHYSPGDQVEGRTSGSFDIAGTQQLVDTIRDTGARNVIVVEGFAYANSLHQWVRFRPDDPLHQLAAELHTYPSSGTSVDDVERLDAMLETDDLNDRYPIILGEFGEPICPDDPGTGFTERTLDWATERRYPFVAWGWDSGEGCQGPSLVTHNDTGATTPHGTIVRDHLRQTAR
jgi:endoglucanase